MKILEIPSDDEALLGQYGPACEGFIDMVKSLFVKKDQIKEDVEKIKKNQYRSYTTVVTMLKRDLANTYENQNWVSTNLEGNSGFTTIEALSLANAGGKEITDPEEILKIAKGMYSILTDMVNREKPFIEHRKKLIAKIENEESSEVVDHVWLDNKKQLEKTAVDRLNASGKKDIPVFGHSKDNPWPVNLKKSTKFFTFYSSEKTSGKIIAPTSSNANSYVKAIQGMLSIIEDVMKIYYQYKVPYWDSLAVNYDDLKYGDDIFNLLCSSQAYTEVANVALDLEETFGTIVCGLYIAMFDKHLVAKTPANEGWVDRVKSVFTPKKQVDIPKYDSHAALIKVLDFHANPDNYTLSGKSFSVNDKLFLSINGKSPDLQQLPATYEKTIADAAKLSKVFYQDSIKHAKAIEPVIQRFEKTVIDAMDREGNIDQDIFDKAFLPLIAAVPKAKQSYYYTFQSTANQCDSYLGGNPFEFKKLSGGGWENNYIELTPTAVPAAKDIGSIKKLVAAFVATTDKEYSGLADDLFEDLDDNWTNYSFDRPVRHLWDIMSQEQVNAIGYIYSEEYNTESLNSTLQDRMQLVYSSLLRYLNDTLVKNKV